MAPGGTGPLVDLSGALFVAIIVFDLLVSLWNACASGVAWTLVPNFNSSACTLHGVKTNTSGFGLSDAQLPITVGALGNGTLDLTVLLPGGAYQGALDLVCTWPPAGSTSRSRLPRGAAPPASGTIVGADGAARI